MLHVREIAVGRAVGHGDNSGWPALADLAETLADKMEEEISREGGSIAGRWQPEALPTPLPAGDHPTRSARSRPRAEDASFAANGDCERITWAVLADRQPARRRRSEGRHAVICLLMRG